LDTFAEAGTFVDMPVSSMMQSLAMLTLLPIFIGMLIRHYLPAFAAKMVEPVRKIAIAILIMVIITNAIFSFDTLRQYTFEAGFAAMLLNLICMSAGYAVARLAKLNLDQTISITFEIGIQNL